jgi:hypothetical protein
VSSTTRTHYAHRPIPIGGEVRTLCGVVAVREPYKVPTPYRAVTKSGVIHRFVCGEGVDSQIECLNCQRALDAYRRGY